MISPNAHSLMASLMCMDPYKRLGSIGIQELKEHPFFADIEWDTLQQSPSPFMLMIPKGKEDAALSHPKANENDDFLREVMNDQMNFIDYN